MSIIDAAGRQQGVDDLGISPISKIPVRLYRAPGIITRRAISAALMRSRGLADGRTPRHRMAAVPPRCQRTRAVSTGECIGCLCEGLFQHLCGGFEPECLSGSSVQSGCDLVKFGLSVPRQVGSFA
jgi:hypothetical protein